MSTMPETDLVDCFATTVRFGRTDVSDEVLKYCLMHQITEACCETADLARDQLPPESTLSFSLEGDGESDEQSLIVHLGIKAPPEEVFRLFDRFVDAWIDRVPTRAQNRMGLTYSAV